MLESWIDPTGDDFALIHEEGRLLPSRPLAFGGPRFLYEHDGHLIEIEPTVIDGFSAWKLTNHGSAAQ